MPELKKGTERQRIRNVTIWVDRKFHKKLKMIAWKKGVSITFVLGEILKEYFEKGGK